jgi:antirestriction protein ArdC
VGSWIKILQDDPLEIFRAAADAEKIQEYIFSLEQQQKPQLEVPVETARQRNHYEQAVAWARLRERTVKADAITT